LIIDLEKDITKKYKSKLLVITGDFFLSDPQITKQTKTGYILKCYKRLNKRLKVLLFLYFSYKTVEVSKLWIKIRKG